jgi:hypothetical protein
LCYLFPCKEISEASEAKGAGVSELEIISEFIWKINRQVMGIL